MLKFKQYIKEITLPSREGGTISQADKNELADIITPKSGAEKAAERGAAQSGIARIRELPPSGAQPSTPVLNPQAGHHERDLNPEYGSGNKKIFSPE